MNESLLLGCCSANNVLNIEAKPFSKAIKLHAHEILLHFYEHDKKFERVRKNPQQWLEFVSKFKIIISPDFSLYWSMPLEMQKANKEFNIYFANELAKRNPNTIYNVRFGDAISYNFCFDGFPKNGVVAVGTHGCTKRYDERIVFEAGFVEMVKRLTPKVIVVYGYANLNVFKWFESIGGIVLRIPSEFELAH
ncbi:MAG: DUF4417 domain-containing protein [Fibrobacteraceae bacterium]|nr:DUF4417 domain-containing protein [Fibrobacteraceae bacterium]MCF0217308.1 DUF4417 domain-containing protein [Fibrobacteraceae bacterium]